MAFSRPTLGALIRDAQAAIAAQLPGTDPLLRRSSLGILARVFAGMSHLIYGYLDWIARQVIPDTAEGVYLDRWSRIPGIGRKPAAPAAGTVGLTGTDGTVLAAGARLVRADGAGFVTTAAATIASGAAFVAVAAELGGDAGNTPAGATLALVVAVSGITGQATVAAGGLAGGAAEESDEALRARFLARMRAPPQGGAAADYLAWALAQPGVTRAWVYPQARGAGTVDVAFVMDDRAAGGGSIVPLTADVAAVQDALDLLRPVTAELLVYGPTATPLNATITGLSPDTAAIRAAILAEMSAQILRDAEPGGTLRRSRLDEAVSRASGESWHTLTVPSGDVTAAAGAIHVPGTVTFA